MPVEHVASYYAASANPAPSRPPLTADVEADVCVVGGGIAGCATALFLAQRGYQVVLLEGNRIAFGASGRSGGQAIVGYACSQDKLVAQVGKADARKMFDISVDALDLLQSLVEQHNIDCDLHLGHLHTAIKPRQEADLRAYQDELASEYGYTSTRWLDQAELGEVLNTQSLRWRPARRPQRPPASAQLHTGTRGCRRSGRREDP